MKQKLFYIANVRFPTEKAHGIQIVEMCQAFASLDLDVELIVPNRRTPIKDSPFGYYQITKDFKIKKLWTIDAVGWGRVGFWTQAVTFAMSVFMYTFFKGGLYFTRDEYISLTLSLLKKKNAWEAHMGQKNVLVKIIIALGTPIVVITEGLKKLYINLGAKEDGVLLAPDAVDMTKFDILVTKEEARKRLGLPAEKKIVLYTGHLYAWKGADIAAESIAYLSSQIQMVFVGGSEKDLSNFKTKYGLIPNISIIGKRSHSEMPLYMKSADVLILPNSAKEDISKFYTSPMKLFEYMASKRTIIASRLPSVMEIVDTSMSYFFNPDDPKHLAETINYVLDNESEAERKTLAAYSEVQKHSWINRAKIILNFLKLR